MACSHTERRETTACRLSHLRNIPSQSLIHDTIPLRHILQSFLRKWMEAKYSFGIKWNLDTPGEEKGTVRDESIWWVRKSPTVQSYFFKWLPSPTVQLFAAIISVLCFCTGVQPQFSLGNNRWTSTWQQCSFSVPREYFKGIYTDQIKGINSRQGLSPVTVHIYPQHPPSQRNRWLELDSVPPTKVHIPS